MFKDPERQRKAVRLATQRYRQRRRLVEHPIEVSQEEPTVQRQLDRLIYQQWLAGAQ